MGTAMKRLLLFVGLLVALVASVSGDSSKEDENSLQNTELDLLNRKPRNADPKGGKQSGRNVKKQRKEKRRQRKKSVIRRDKKNKKKKKKKKKKEPKKKKKKKKKKS